MFYSVYNMKTKEFHKEYVNRTDIHKCISYLMIGIYHPEWHSPKGRENWRRARTVDEMLKEINGLEFDIMRHKVRFA